MQNNPVTEAEQARNFSVIIPVFNSASTLVELTQRLTVILNGICSSYQLIFINDASPDNSTEVLQHLAGQFPQHIQVIHHTKNRGQRESVRAGLMAASGDTLVVMDADLQDSPEAIALLEQTLVVRNVDAVFAIHTGLYQPPWRMASSRAFKWLTSKITGLPQGAGSFVIFTRPVAEHILAQQTRQFYLAGLITLSGYPFSWIAIERHKRPQGESSYTTAMRTTVALAYLHCLLELTLKWLRKKT